MKDNRFFIVEDDGRSLQVLNGVVTPSSQPVPLKNVPKGWQEMLVIYERLIKTFGTQRLFSTPLGFVLDGATIVSDTILRENYERNLSLLIQKLTPEVDASFYRLIYKYLYKGEIDLSTAKGEDTQITCNIMEGGISKKIKANEATFYEIPFDGDSILVKMDGILITGVYKWLLPERTIGGTGFPMNMALIGNEQKAPGIAVFDVFSSEPIVWSAINADRSDYFLMDRIPPEGGTGRFTGTIRMANPTPPDPAGIILHVFNTISNTIRAVTYLYTGPEADVINIDIEVDVLEGDRFFLEIDEYTLESDLTFTIQTKQPTSYIKAYKPFDLYRKLIELTTGSANNASSELLQQEWNFVITSGDALRGIPDAKIKISQDIFHQHTRVQHFSGDAVENGKAVIETRPRFYDASNPIELGVVKNFDWSFARDIMGNTFKIGWADPEINDVNGKYAFNGSHLYGSPITRIVGEQPYVSPMSADPYEQELTRVNFEGKTTTDSESDNKNYVMNVVKTTPDVQIATVDFSNSLNAINLPFDMGYIQGQVIRISGSLNNDRDLTIIAAVNLGPVNFLIVDGPLTDESDVSVQIEIITGSVHELRRVTYDSLTGVPTDTVYNIEGMTPKRLLKKHGRWLRSLLWPFDSDKMVFRTTKRNDDLKTVLGSTTIEEKADEFIYQLGERMFIPIYFEFETVIPTNLIDLLEAEPNRCFSFIWQGQTYKGFNVKVSIAINSGEQQRIKLLCAPDVNVQNLIIS